MKKILLLILSLGLTAGLFTACFNVVNPPSSSTNNVSSSAGEDGTSSDTSSSAVKTYVIAFYQEGQDPIQRKVVAGGELKDIPTPVQKTGYTVTWNVTDFTNITQDMSVEAVATPNTYTITYDAGEGTSSIDTQKVTYDKAPESFATATREGYTFVCWQYEGKAMQPTEIWQIASDVTLVAQWSTTEKYTVSFVQDGCETIEILAVDGRLDEADIPTPQPKVGYTVTWEEKDLTNITGNMTVQAIATPNTYTITYDANDGTSSLETQKVTYDQVPESFATATRTGYTFVAWTYEGKTVQPTEAWKIADDVTLVAVWVPGATYTVSFVQDGCAPITITATDGGSINESDIPTPQPKVGYTVTWEEKDLTNIGANITVNAIATPNTYTITYDAGEGTASLATQKVTYDSAPGSFATATLAGYDFIAWTYEGKTVQPTELWKIASDVTLVAQWSAIKYAVNFVQDGEETVSVWVEAGKSLEQQDIPTPKDKEGYTVSWEEKDLTNIKGNITVNAIATPNKYTITYDAGDGTATLTTQEVTYDKAPESFATATKEGYKFKGWAYNGKTVSETELWKIAEDVTLTAVWAKIYTINFIVEGGSIDDQLITVVEGEVYRLPEPVSDSITVIFSNWYFGSQKVATTGVWSISSAESTITLKATWKQREWTKDY